MSFKKSCMCSHEVEGLFENCGRNLVLETTYRSFRSLCGVSFGSSSAVVMPRAGLTISSLIPPAGQWKCTSHEKKSTLHRPIYCSLEFHTEQGHKRLQRHR